MKKIFFIFILSSIVSCNSNNSKKDMVEDFNNNDSLNKLEVFEQKSIEITKEIQKEIMDIQKAEQFEETDDLKTGLLECPNLPDSFRDNLNINDAGEEKISDCIGNSTCFKPMISAHRGFHKIDVSTENSIDSLLYAIDIGVDIIEIDVRETKDGYLVLMHDSTVDRTTNGTGNVSEMTLEQIKELNLINPISKAVLEDQKVPTLKEALEVTKGKVILNLDLKTNNMKLIAQFFQKNNAYEYAIARKGSLSALIELHNLDNKIKVMPNLDKIEDLETIIEKVNPVIVELHEIFEKQEIEKIHSKGIKTLIDTLGPVDIVIGVQCTSELLDKFEEVKIDVLQTDIPQFLCPLYKGYTEKM